MKNMSNAEKVQIATDMLDAIESEDAEAVGGIVIDLVARNNPRLGAYAPLARAAMAAVLRRLFGGEDEDDGKSVLEDATKEVAVDVIADVLSGDGDREYAWYDPRGWF